jgi:hypothetical protein
VDRLTPSRLRPQVQRLGQEHRDPIRKLSQYASVSIHSFDPYGTLRVSKTWLLPDRRSRDSRIVGGGNHAA